MANSSNAQPIFPILCQYWLSLVIFSCSRNIGQVFSINTGTILPVNMEDLLDKFLQYLTSIVNFQVTLNQYFMSIVASVNIEQYWLIIFNQSSSKIHYLISIILSHCLTMAKVAVQSDCKLKGPVSIFLCRGRVRP